jgi:glycosyltransferase involved in cell wall biosynthesis
MTGGAHVAILMATRNGADFLTAQLDSIARQSHGNWSLTVSDDGSTDGTRAIVADFAARHPDRRIFLVDGPGKGATAIFLSLLCRARDSADIVALADQDDVWLSDKLARGLAALGASGGTAPSGVLYGARTAVVGPDLSPRGLSPLFRRPPGFANALVQSLAGGNTMMLDARLMARVRTCTADLLTSGAVPVAHDWWLYQIATGTRAAVIFDPVPSVLYRQHGRNLVGANTGLPARLRRMSALLSGRFAAWSAANLAALAAVEAQLTCEARATLAAFAALKGRRGLAAVAQLHRAGLYRQSRGGTVSLAVAAAIGRL